MEWKWAAEEGGRHGGGQKRWKDRERGQSWKRGWRARAPTSDRKRNPALIRPLPLVNWTRQLSCQVINSLRKFSALSQAGLNTAIWIDKQSPVCTKCLLDSFVSQHPLPPLDNTPAQLTPRFSSSLFSWPPFSLSLLLVHPLSFLTSLTFTHWSLCHFLNNDPGAEGTTAYLYFITVSPSPAGLGDQAVQGRESGGKRQKHWKRDGERGVVWGGCPRRWGRWWPRQHQEWQKHRCHHQLNPANGNLSKHTKLSLL